jgi:hypothetical protein
MFKIIALDMVAAPNTFSYADQNLWKVTQDGAATLWGMLYVHDSLSDRRYIPSPGAILTVTFYRSDIPGSDTHRSIIKVVSFSVADASLFSLDLTAQDVKTITSGTVNFNLVEGAVSTSWNQNWMAKKVPVRTGI